MNLLTSKGGACPPACASSVEETRADLLLDLVGVRKHGTCRYAATQVQQGETCIGHGLLSG